MSIVIDEPFIEHQLETEAAKHGVSAEQYAVNILSTYLRPMTGTGELSAEQRIARLDALIASSANRKSLPPEAFERASYYTK
jgi:hypothetical protein